MKIWILNHYAGLPAHVPGTRSYDLAKRLSAKGHQVTVFASSFSYYRHEEEHLDEGEGWRQEEHEGIRFIWIRSYPYFRNDWRRFLNFLEYAVRALVIGLKKSSDRPDIIIGTCVHPLSPLVAWLLSKRYSVPFCYEVTDLWPQTLVDMGAMSKDGLAATVLYKLEKFLFIRSVRIISLLPYVNKYVEEIGLDGAKVVWIPNGIDASRCVLGEEKQHDGLFRVIYAGGFSKAQGLETIIEAAKIIKERGYDQIRFILYGDGKERAVLQAKVEEEQISNVTFPGMVKKKEIYQRLNEGDIFVSCLQDLPLFKHGISPNKLMDYFIVGKPIIFAIKASNNPVAEAGAGVSIAPEDPQAMADATISFFNTSEAELKEMGERGRKYVLANHEFDILADKLESVLYEIIKESGSAG